MQCSNGFTAGRFTAGRLVYTGSHRKVKMEILVYALAHIPGTSLLEHSCYSVL
jgi:hypothetical protein